MMEIFERWGAQTSRYRFAFIDYIEDLPTLVGLHKRSLPPTKSDFGWRLGLVRDAASRIEELAQVVFFLAVEDVLPQEAARFAHKPWIDIEAISLEPKRWEADGLFRPTTRPRDIRPLDAEIRRLFGRETHGDATGWRNPGVSWRRAISDLSPDVLRPALSSGRCGSSHELLLTTSS